MEKVGNTASLRCMAPHWSLAGDKQLLNTLQDIHQKIITRCQETNTILEEMITSLDGANIDMQNVNNKFMALSTSQFVESRVYDDDVDVMIENSPKHDKPTIQPEPESELAKLKQSLKILESMHESVQILDSDSGSDTDDDDGRMVYKPRDLYTQRPLPHIIGSYAWKSKWHAGIIPEDSDTDSSTSKPGDVMLEQYSESESEQTDTRTDKLHPPPRTISSSSSVVDSEPSGPAAPVSQADIAAELARKLGGNLPEMPVTSAEPEFISPEPTQKKIYKPQKPETSTIFFDEPPPLEQTYQSDKEEYNYDEDDDIFAELHRKKPSFSTANDQSRLNEDLFGGLNNSRDVVDDVFSIDKKNLSASNNNEQNERSNEAEKKPIGGISLFGSIKGTESIGAAILKRNQRKSYSSDEESENEAYNNKYNLTKEIQKGSTSKPSENAIKDNKQNIINKSDETEIERKTSLKHEKDLLRDIFDKNKNSKVSIENMSTKQDPVAKDNKIDLFSDNIFDDVDNIFTDNIIKAPIKEADKIAKSIFDDDDDDDDLFADIAITQHKTSNSQGTHNKVKSLFDSDNDDDLFSDTLNKSSVQQTSSIKSENINPGSSAIMINNKETKILFDDIDDDIFFKVKSSLCNDTNEVNFKESKQEREPVNSIDINKDVNLRKDDDNNNLFSKNSLIGSSELGNNTEENTIIVSKNSEQINNKCSGEGYKNTTSDNHNVSLTPHLNSACQNSESSPALFDDVEPDDLLKPHSNFACQNSEFSPALFDNEEPDDLFNNKCEKENEFGGTYLNCGKENESRNTMNVESLNNKTEDKNIIGSINIIKSENNISDMSEIVTSAHPKSKDDISPITVQKSHNDNLGISDKNYTFDDNMDSSLLPQTPLFYKPDMFSDIFNDVPPDFEKPKEPKKSKNVNALFDDDSDDEIHFFKKDDTISDEKPDLSSPAKHDNLFRIFSDEPPAIDMNVTQKNNDDQGTKYEDYKKLDLKDSDNSFIHPFHNEINDNKNQRENIQQRETDITDDLTENVINTENIKSVGKLKAMNLNINVNTLLPGASPKKYKPIEETYEQNISTIDIDKNSLMKNTESKLEKSISFEDDANSELLDNKFSKERAKIQVKRRPSTRRARREAVKKSESDFGSKDSTDNSTSVGDPVATPDKKIERSAYQTDEKSSKVKDVKSKIVYILNDEDIFSNVNSDKTISQISKTSVLNKLENQQHSKSNTTLDFDDGDDLFRNVKVSKAESSAVVNSTEKVEISNNMISNLSSVTNVMPQQRKVDKENSNVSIKVEANIDKPNKTKVSIFDDMSDEETELFLSKKPIVSKTKNIFGSDSDEELFASKKSTEQLEEKLKPTNVKVEVKKSLFDDDSDDELFVGKRNSTGNNPLFSKAKEEKPSHTQSVIEDPLSMITDNDFNNDL